MLPCSQESRAVGHQGGAALTYEQPLYCTGVPREIATPQDPTVGPCLGSYCGPRVGGWFLMSEVPTWFRELLGPRRVEWCSDEPLTLNESDERDPDNSTHRGTGLFCSSLLLSMPVLRRPLRLNLTG